MGARVSQARQSSLNDLRKQVGKMITDFAEVTRKVNVNHQQINSFFKFVGETEAKVEAIKTIGIREGIFTEEQFEDVLDEVKQLRRRKPEEKVQKGDIMRLDYTALEAGQVVMQEKDFPYRATGELMFDEQIIDKTVEEVAKPQTFDYTYPENYAPNPALAGKALTFTLSVAKVKTSIQEAGDGKQ